MDIGIHGINKIMVDRVHKLMSSGTHVFFMNIITDRGREDITFYADDAAKLEIVQVDNINDFYESEPAA